MDREQEKGEELESAVLTVDLVLLARNQIGQVTQILLIDSKFGWSLPGGKVRRDEEITDALQREVEEEIGVASFRAHPLFVRHQVGRDPRGRYVSFVCRTVLPSVDQVDIQAGSDAKEARWFSLSALPALAFDHLDMVKRATLDLPNGLVAVEIKEKQG